MAKIKVDDNILSVDLGYSGVKYYFKHKGKAFFGKIPTAVKKIDDEDIYDDEVFEYNGSKYLIGEDAIDQDVNISLNAGTLIKNAPLLIYAILKLNNIEHKDLSLITGLSLKDFDDRGGALIEILKDFTVNNEQIKLDVSLLPQGRGIAYDYFSKKPQENLALILDIGYNTLDFIAMKKDKLSIRNSFANTNGINIILNRLQYELDSQFDIKRTTTELNEAISANNKTLKHRGEIIDFGDALKDITEDYIDNIKRNISKKDDILERADILILGGGGAYILRAISDEDLQKMFNFKNIVFVDEPYEFSNARGYYARELSPEENNEE
ncbi:ParM/StbA family protein [Campylobacter showae]|uniref:ParM/StbA family protein n=1 Tax=Campylobacter showae TaxID=204 RepID=UPI000F07D0E4|nr:ParM/StbA family protein [Campylobacter showae]